MIITVTMNPAIDKTIDIHRFVHGGLNRITHMELDAGGKGINVSKTIQQLGGTSLATGFVGGAAGDRIEQTLKEYGIPTDFIRVEGETRTNTKVVEENGTVTELNEPGPYVSEKHIHELIQKLDSYASPDTLVVLAGSIPKSTDKTIYRTITEKMHDKGAAVLLDADGELFLHALSAQPDIIKPNQAELEEYYRKKEADDSGFSASLNHHASLNELIEMGQQLLASGIRTAVISMGSEGALFLNHDTVLQSAALPVPTHSTVGAGDAMVAALAYGWEKKLSFEACASLAMAASAGAVMTVGTKPPTLETVQELLRLLPPMRISFSDTSHTTQRTPH